MALHYGSATVGRHNQQIGTHSQAEISANRYPGRLVNKHDTAKIRFRSSSWSGRPRSVARDPWWQSNNSAI